MAHGEIAQHAPFVFLGLAAQGGCTDADSDRLCTQVAQAIAEYADGRQYPDLETCFAGEGL